MSSEIDGQDHTSVVPLTVIEVPADKAEQIHSLKSRQNGFSKTRTSQGDLDNKETITPAQAEGIDNHSAAPSLSSLPSKTAGIEDEKYCEDISRNEDLATTAKKQQIHDACISGDFARLQALAESDRGFLTDELRQLAWPVLLGIPLDSNGSVDAKTAAAAAGIPSEEATGAWKDLPAHRDEEQVQLDVNRAFVYYPNHSNDAEEVRQKQALSALIVEVLRRYPFLCYFQGFHDICQVFLLVLPPPLRTPAVVRLAVLRIRDFMLPSIDAAVQQLLLLPDILRAADPPLWNHLRLAQHPRPFFALSGTLTMYAHDVQSLGAIARLFDVLLARGPAFSLYLFAAIACAHRAALFATPADEPEMLHHILSKLPGRTGSSGTNGSDDDHLEGVDSTSPPSLDELITAAAKLAAAHPPQTLPAWRLISPASVLKTAQEALTTAAAAAVAEETSTKPLATGLTVADGERLFHEHVRDLERAERRRQQQARMRQLLRKYRGPIRAVGVAVLVGAIAVLLRRAGVGQGGAGALSFLSNPIARASALFSRLRG